MARPLALTLALLCAAPAMARESRLEPIARPARWGAGFMLGDPFGLTLKHYGRQSFDLYAAFAYGPGIRFGGDWLWDLGRIERQPKFDLDLYMGAGPFIGAFQGPCGPGFITDRCNGDVYFGGRVPFGIELLLKEAPVTFGLEVAPGIGFAPGRAGLLLDFLLAVRFLL